MSRVVELLDGLGEHVGQPFGLHPCTTEYFTALGAQNRSAESGGGTHASPIPHLRRAHERELTNGRRIWIESTLVNVRREGDIAFVERRKGYTR